MKTLFPVALCLAALLAASAQADDSVKRILDRGRDGDTNYYQVMCGNGTMGSVKVVDQPPQICAQPDAGQETCNTAWTLNDAAAASCK